MLISTVPVYFKERRERLMKAQPGSAFIFPSGEEVLRNPDVHFAFRQESNFYYLTGFEEPESVLVLTPSKSKPGALRTVLFVRQRDPEKEMWEGERYGVEGVLRVFQVDEAYPIDEFEKKLPELLDGVEKVQYRLGLNEFADRRILGAIEVVRRSQGRSGKAMLPILDPSEAVGEMRLFKSPEEILLLRRACEISALAHLTAMKEVRPGMNEFEVEALVDYVLRKSGCQRVGYGSIVAGGKNATCLHYRSNNETLKDGDLLLIDAGGEYGYYTGDITRTFPIGKKFSSAQAKIYQIVLQSQKAAIEMSKPGANLPAIHKKVCEVLVDGMLSLGLLQGKKEDIVSNSGFKRFYPHNTSHWLGMDVHDVGLYKKNGEPRLIEAGMVFTIEPGFYVQPNDSLISEEFRNIGIRIEDDILITSSGNQVLTSGVPKEIKEIEALRSY